MSNSMSSPRESLPLFELLRRQSRDFFAGRDDPPPEGIWARTDVVPMGQFCQEDHAAWTCFRRDGQIVDTLDAGDREQLTSYNALIGRWMQRLPAASGFLRPVEPVMCPACRGSGTASGGGVCGCGGLGWRNGGIPAEPGEETVALFDLLRQMSRDSFVDQERRPSEALWARGDVVPFDDPGNWYDDVTTCLRRDGHLVVAGEANDRLYPMRHYNACIGFLMEKVPAASGYLRPDQPWMCFLCRGSGRLSGQRCTGCGGQGWMDRHFFPNEDDAPV